MSYKKSILVLFLAALSLPTWGFQTDHKVLYEKAKFTMETKGDLQGAIKLFQEIIDNYPNEREYAAKSQLQIGLCKEKLGLQEAVKEYQKVIDGYPEQQSEVSLAREKISNIKEFETSA